LTPAPRTTGRVVRKIAAAIVLVPLGIVVIAFAVANRQDVTVSFDPFNPAQPAFAWTMWLFVPIFIALIAGVVIGGLVSAMRHGRLRRSIRRLERDIDRLHAEIDVHRRSAGAPAAPAEPAASSAPRERLTLRAPVR
jgi:uncharacterized membrane protein YciS (DUF1049 family)